MLHLTFSESDIPKAISFQIYGKDRRSANLQTTEPGFLTALAGYVLYCWFPEQQLLLTQPAATLFCMPQTHR